jgi:hypothetical protein
MGARVSVAEAMLVLAGDLRSLEGCLGLNPARLAGRLAALQQALAEAAAEARCGAEGAAAEVPLPLPPPPAALLLPLLTWRPGLLLLPPEPVPSPAAAAVTEPSGKAGDKRWQRKEPWQEAALKGAMDWQRNQQEQQQEQEQQEQQLHSQQEQQLHSQQQQAGAGPGEEPWSSMRQVTSALRGLAAALALPAPQAVALALREPRLLSLSPSRAAAAVRELEGSWLATPEAEAARREAGTCLRASAGVAAAAAAAHAAAEAAAPDAAPTDAATDSGERNAAIGDGGSSSSSISSSVTAQLIRAQPGLLVVAAGEGLERRLARLEAALKAAGLQKGGGSSGSGGDSNGEGGARGAAWLRAATSLEPRLLIAEPASAAGEAANLPRRFGVPSTAIRATLAALPGLALLPWRAAAPRLRALCVALRLPLAGATELLALRRALLLLLVPEPHLRRSYAELARAAAAEGLSPDQLPLLLRAAPLLLMPAPAAAAVTEARREREGRQQPRQQQQQQRQQPRRRQQQPGRGVFTRLAEAAEEQLAAEAVLLAVGPAALGAGGDGDGADGAATVLAVAPPSVAGLLRRAAAG